LQIKDFKERLEKFYRLKDWLNRGKKYLSSSSPKVIGYWLFTIGLTQI
jgi:hypothetical protein